MYTISYVYIYHLFLGCTQTQYGYHCPELCSPYYAVPRECDLVTGECIRGCQAGWKGPMCDQSMDVFIIMKLVTYTCMFITVLSFEFCQKGTKWNIRSKQRKTTKYYVEMLPNIPCFEA